MQLRTVGGKATLLTRKGLDWSAKFPAIVKAGAALGDGIIDGEVVALDHTGAPDFAALQAAISDGKTENLVFFVFDQMFAGKEDLRPLPLVERKARLRTHLEDAPANIRYVDHFVTAGDAVLQSACRMDLEGIVSKQLDAPYQSGRSESWGKSKCRQGHEVVIGGWTTTGDAFRSLIAGVNRDGELVHVGRIGTGFGRDVGRPDHAAAQGAGDRRQPLHRQGRAEEGGRRPLGEARSWWPRSNTPASPATAPSARRRSRACARTSPPRRSRPRRRRRPRRRS